MVTDFKNLECIKILVDDILDHKFILDIKDPLFFDITGLLESDVIWDEYELGTFKNESIQEVLYSIDDANIRNALKEKLEGFVMVKFVPTSENLCKMFGDIASLRLKKLTGERVRVSYVDFWETPKSHCRYTLPQ